MARGKNSPALFEVIRNAQQKQKEQLERQRQQELTAAVHAHSPAAALLRSPIYWFKGKHAHQAAIEGPDADVDLPVMREVPKPRAQPKVEAKPVEAAAPKAPEPTKIIAAPKVAEPSPAYAPVPRSPAAEAARQVREEIFAAQEAPAAEPLFHVPAHDEPHVPADFNAHLDDHSDDGVVSRRPAGYNVNAVDDEDDQPQPPLFNLRFNFTTATIAAFAIVTAFTVAYVIGNHNQKAQLAAANAKPVQQSTNTTAGVAQNTPKRSDVLNVRPGGETARVYSSVPDPTPAPTPDDARANVTNGVDAIGLDTLGKPIAIPTNVKRVVGVQYLVLLSFPREEDAKELVKFLAQNGVPATAERALPDYAKSWTSVVTTRGFDRTKNNPAYTAYSEALQDLLKKYAGENGFRKTFKVDLYKWRTAAR